MGFARGIFLIAIGTLVIGFLIGRALIGPMFSSDVGSGASLAAQLSDTPTATSVPATARTTHSAGRKHAAPATGTVTATPEASATPTASPKATPTVTPRPQPTPTPGTITLDRYWIATQQARRGRIIEIGYVIDNGTGRVSRVMLGASLKSNHVLDWATQSISDPAHDVVATVPVGVSTHYRFFTLPTSLRPGMYDVAWGLRDAASGRRDALVFAPAVLRVTR